MKMSHTLQAGDRIGEYEILNVLGHPGGFGVTYRAMSYPNHIEVAIKEYFPTIAVRQSGSHLVRANSHSSQDEYNIGLNRFRIEAEMLERFNHINIVKIFSVFEANGTAYMVMEYERGQDLGQYMDAVNRPLSYTEIIQYFIPILDGLRAVHRQNILHLDLKPDNIFIRDNSTPCLIDFGGARHYAAQESRLVVAKVSFMVAADGYSPPEQYSDDAASKGPWSDIYSLGATIYSCMDRGKIPPSSTDRSNRIVNDENDPLQAAVSLFKDKYPQDLLELVDRCLSPQRTYRPQDASEMQDILIKVANDEAVRWEEKKPVTTKPVKQAGFFETPPSENPSKQPNIQGAYAPANSHVEPSNTTGNQNYAGFWARAAALLLDTVIIVAVFVIIGVVIGMSGIEVPGVTGANSDQFGPVDIAGFFFQWLYFAGMESGTSGGTFGKRAVRIRVVDLNGNRISFGKATGRYFGKILSFLILFIGYLMAGFTRKKQGLHDMMAGTLVIQKG